MNHMILSAQRIMQLRRSRRRWRAVAIGALTVQALVVLFVLLTGWGL